MNVKNRRARLTDNINELLAFRSCAMTDELEVQWGTLANYRELLIQFRILSKGLIPSEYSEEVDKVPEFNGLEEMWNSKAHLDAILPDIALALYTFTENGESPPQYSLISRRVIESLESVVPKVYDTKKLLRYCKEINSTFYHGNIVASLLLMRTVLNYVPPVFDQKTFAQVSAQSGKSFMAIFENLDNGLRKIADLHAHNPIKCKEEYPTRNQVEPFIPLFEVLLQEVINKLK